MNRGRFARELFPQPSDVQGRRRVSPVKVTKPDGTVEYQRAYTHEEAQKVVGVRKRRTKTK